MLVWQECVIGAEISSEFPKDLITPGEEVRRSSHGPLLFRHGSPEAKL
jgi:hypothetical protein